MVAQIDNTSYGSVDSIIINAAGTGYAEGDVLAVTNPTHGSGLAGKVAVVNGGFTLEQDTLDDGIIMLEGSSTDQLVMEAQTNSGTNDITKILITNAGGGYLSLPTVTVTSSGGSGADVFPVSDSIGKALSVKPIDQGFRYEEPPGILPKLHMQIDNVSGAFAVNETVSSTKEDNIILEPFQELDYAILLEDHRQAVIRLDGEQGDLITEDGDSIAFEELATDPVFDGFEQDKIITEDGDKIVNTVYEVSDTTDYLTVTHNGSDDSRLLNEDTSTTTAVVEELLDSDTNILTLNTVDGTFDDKVTLTGGTSGATARVRSADTAIMSSSVGTVIETDGEFSGVDGFISESTKKIQDSLYYQDYSYIVKVGESITEWRDYLKSAVHPAGFYFAGEVSIRSRLNARMKTGFTRLSGKTEDDEVIEILTVIFGEKLGRRLGTATDGSSLRSNPESTIELDASFTANTRAVTLNQDITIKLNQQRTPNTTVHSTTPTTGVIYAGPRLATVGRFALTAFGETNGMSGVTLKTLNDLKIMGTNTSIDGDAVQIGDFTLPIHTNFALPCEVSYQSDDFSSTGPAATTFDTTGKTFDDNAK